MMVYYQTMFQGKKITKSEHKKNSHFDCLRHNCDLYLEDSKIKKKYIKKRFKKGIALQLMVMQVWLQNVKLFKRSSGQKKHRHSDFQLTPPHPPTQLSYMG